MTPRGYTCAVLDAVLPALTKVARDVQKRAVLEEKLQTLVDGTAELFGATHASVRLLHPSHSHLVAACRSGPSLHPGPGAEFRSGEGLVGWVVEHSSPLRLDEPTKDPRFVAKPGFTGMGCFLGAPLLSTHACLGALSVVRWDKPFSETEEQLLELVAAICAPPLEIARLSRLTKLDPLTGALNRRGLEEGYQPETPSTDTPMAVLMVDIDRFKAINDSHGHVVGDVVLRRVARQLSRVLRASDAIVRYGGEEFLLLLSAVTLSQAQRVAERARKSIEAQVIRVGGAKMNVTVSMGIDVQREGEALSAAVERADAALYRAKREGRNRVIAASAAGPSDA